MAKNDITIGAAKLGPLITQVESELATMLKNEEAAEAQRLAKARPGEETEGSADASPPASASDPTGDNTSAASASPDASSPAGPGAGDASSASASPDASAGGPPAGLDDGSTPPDASASPDGGAPADPAAEQGPIDPQQLAGEYAKMPLEDLKAHYYAIKEVLFQASSAAGADPSASAGAPPDASASAGAPPPPDAAGAPAIKAEIGMKEDTKANGENPLHKAEAPTRDEVRAALRERITDGTPLSKSDRLAIVGYDIGTMDLSKVQHLLTPMAKSEPTPKVISAPVKVEEGGLSKAEADKLRSDLDRTNTAVAGLMKAMEVAIGTPARKSVQFSADLKKAEANAPASAAAAGLSRDEVRAKLRDKIAEPGVKLSKSDREAIALYDLNKVSVDKVAHLLK